MEERGVISGYQGSKPREVLMSKEKWQELKMGTSSNIQESKLENEANQNNQETISNNKEIDVQKTIEAVKKIGAMNNSEEQY